MEPQVYDQSEALSATDVFPLGVRRLIVERGRDFQAADGGTEPAARFRFATQSSSKECPTLGAQKSLFRPFFCGSHRPYSPSGRRFRDNKEKLLRS